MKQVSVHASHDYTVTIAPGLLDTCGETIRAVTPAKTAALICGDQVGPLYAARVRASLERSGFAVVECRIPHGESHKTLETYGELLVRLSENHVTRSDVVVALGGGVTGDLAGFVAATYQRGMGFVQLPTTLLAAVDSSVGGKVAVDLPTGKNQVGAFYQPLAVLCDPNSFSTLPPRELRCGCAEIIKTAVLFSRPFFDTLRQFPISEHFEEVIERCVTFKRNIVARDEFDRGERALLNLGHTFGHAVEACSGFTVQHGEGVAIGLAMIARAAERRGLCSAETCSAIVGLLQQYGLPTDCPYRAEELLEALKGDKKSDGAVVKLIVPRAIGHCEIVPVPLGECLDWLRDGGAP